MPSSPPASPSCCHASCRGAILAAVWDPEEAEQAGGAGEAAAKWGLSGWVQACHQVRCSTASPRAEAREKRQMEQRR